jgi:hypothetical protein
MLKAAYFATIYTFLVGSAFAQSPQSVLNALIQRQMQQDQLRQQNEMMRLEIERLNLEQELRFRRETDYELSQELSRYCPGGQPPCLQNPPDALLQEAGRRGLIQFTARAPSTGQRGLDCVTFGDGEGGGITDCLEAIH